MNAYGLPEAFTMTGGHINDCTESPALIEKIDAAQVLIADKGYDKLRHLVENAFARLKHYRAVATRYDKLA